VGVIFLIAYGNLTAGWTRIRGAIALTIQENLRTFSLPFFESARPKSSTQSH
jgi:hypothetical protein